MNWQNEPKYLNEFKLGNQRPNPHGVSIIMIRILETLV